MVNVITNQVIKISIEELRAITKVDLCVFDLDGSVVASTFKNLDVKPDIIVKFSDSQADSQVIGTDHLLKISDDKESAYILLARGASDDTYMVAKIAVSQIQHLIAAYKEKLDRNNFFQNLIMDNLLLVDIYNRAKRLHIDVTIPYVVILVETKLEKDSTASEFMKSMFSAQNGDYITAVDEKNVILIKSLPNDESYESVEKIAHTIVDMMSTEAMLNVRVSYGTIVPELKDVSKSYKEAKMALEVGKIFHMERKINAYNSLGIGRLVYQLPINLCKIFVEEIFGKDVPFELDEETLITVKKFFDNSLNVSETSRQLFVHRNTLVYRIEKLQKSTGLDIRTFDDALTLKIAMMVISYIKYLETLS